MSKLKKLQQWMFFFTDTYQPYPHTRGWRLPVTFAQLNMRFVRYMDQRGRGPTENAFE